MNEDLQLKEAIEILLSCMALGDNFLLEESNKLLQGLTREESSLTEKEGKKKKRREFRKISIEFRVKDFCR